MPKNEKYDLVILATGYRRNPFCHVLKSLQPLLEKPQEGEQFAVGRDYRVKFQPGKVANDAAIWLQGSCESTHGVSSAVPHSVHFLTLDDIMRLTNLQTVE